jgi:uncharacterized protein YjdB
MKRIILILLLAGSVVAVQCDPQEPNPRPELGSMTAQHTLRAGEVIREPISASDPDKDAMTFGIIDNPGFVSIEDELQIPGMGSASATLVIAPSIGQSGTYQFRVRVEDSDGDADSESCTVVVTPPVASVSVTPSSATVTVGATTPLTATPKDAQGNALDRPVSWSSSDPAVAAVDGSGLVTGVAEGSATVTASSEGKSGSAAITVTPIPVASVDVSPASATIEVDETVDLDAVPRDADGNALDRPVTWSSSNTSVATVDADGLVTGVAEGTATITATCEGKTGTAAITVNPPPGPSIEWHEFSPRLVWSHRTGYSTAYQWFNVIAGSAEVEIVATERGTTESISTTHPVQEGRRYRASLRVTLSGSRSASPGEACAVFDYSSPSTAGIVSSTFSARFDPLDNNYYCPTSFSLTSLIVDNAVASVTVAPGQATVTIGETQQFTATMYDAEGVQLDRFVIWSSSDESVATINYDGLATSVAVGSTSITANSEGITDNASLTVEGSSVIPEPGPWQALTGFGGFVLTVNDASTAITEILYDFQDWACGPATRNGMVGVTSSGWSITGGQFTIENTIDPNLTITVQGTFESNNHATGEWTAVSYGTTCSGSWEAESATKLYLHYDSGTGTLFLSPDIQAQPDTWYITLSAGGTAEWTATLDDPLVGDVYTLSLLLATGTAGAPDGSFDVSLLARAGGETSLAATSFTVPYADAYRRYVEITAGTGSGSAGDELVLRVAFNGPAASEPGELLFGRDAPDSHILLPGSIATSLLSTRGLVAARTAGVVVKRYERKGLRDHYPR